MILNKETFYISNESAIPNDVECFYGYCFYSGELYHYKKKLPSVEKLLSSLNENQGIFVALYRSGGDLYIFSDPLSQYSIFYTVREQGKFEISNDISLLFANTATLNQSAIIDSISYFSPIGNSTLLEGVQTLRPHQYIKVKDAGGRPVFSIESFNMNSYESCGDIELFEICIERMRHRASAVLEDGKPIVQLTGGQDSRLTLAAFMSVTSQENYFVSCLGTNRSSDKKVFNYLYDQFGLNGAAMCLSSGKPKNLTELSYLSKSFNGLKHSAHSNYNSAWMPDHMEVTGYFSEGILKDFGNYFGAGSFAPFKYAKTISVLPDYFFDSAAFRLYEDLSSPDLRNMNFSTRINYLYLNNRSTAQLGMQSVVNNRSFLAVDPIYDPLLILLFDRCSLNSRHRAEGALICELTRSLAGDTLAFAPLADRKISNYANLGFYDEEPSAFNLKLDELSNPDIDVRSFSNPLFSIGEDFLTFSDFLNHNLFEAFLSEFPVFSIYREVDTQSYRRKAEFEAVLSLFGFWLYFNGSSNESLNDHLGSLNPPGFTEGSLL